MTGYTTKATTFDFDKNGEHIVITSNATTYIEAMESVGLTDAKLLRAVTYAIYDGKKHDNPFTPVVWGVLGTLPSGKDVIEYLVEKKAITPEDALVLLNAREVRL